MNWKFVVLLLSFFLAYDGYDGLKGNKELVEYSIENIEKSGTGDNRYIKINNVYATGQFVYETDKNLPNITSSVIFPLISKSRFEKMEEGETNISINVLVKRSSKRFNSNCISDTSCINDVFNQQDKGYSIKGLTLIGLNDVDDKTRNLLSSSGFNINNKVVFLEEDTEPSSSTKSILMLIGGIVGLIGILSTFTKSQTVE